MAATTASTEAPGGHGGFPPFQSENFLSQLVWLAVTFVLLYALMSRIALPRIAGILAGRDKRIADDIAAAPNRSPTPPASSRRLQRRRPTSSWKHSCTNALLRPSSRSPQAVRRR